MTTPFSVHEAPPAADAVVWGDETISYRALALRVGGAQWALRDQGLSPGTLVALEAQNNLDALVVLSAVVEEGGVPCLLHPRWPEARKSALVERVGAQARLEVGALACQPPRPPPPAVPHRPEDEDFAIFFTSGTTALPKGVRLSRRAFRVSAEASAENLGWRAGDRWLNPLPLAHIGGFSIVTRTRVAGQAVVLPEPSAAARFDPDVYVETLARRRVTLASVVPTMLVRLVRSGHHAPSCLRAMLVGGAPAAPRWLEAARNLGWPVLTTYGMTEACSQVASQRPGGTGEGVGWPLSGVELELREGQIHLRGGALFTGYLPATDSFEAGGWFATGDRARWGEHGLVVEGRISDLIVSGGENLAPLRIEQALEAHPAVRAAVVVGLPDEEWGERAVATLVMEPDEELAAGTLRTHLVDRLASFERPRGWRRVEALPLLPNGKVDRTRVREDCERSGVAELPEDMA